MRLSEDQQLWIAPPEYVIIRKLEFYREGGSDKHLRDINRMLPQVKNILDNYFLDRELEIRNLEAYWQKAIAYL